MPFCNLFMERPSYHNVFAKCNLACFLQNVVVLRCIYYWMTLLLPCRTAAPTATIKIGRAVTLCPNCALRGPHMKTIKMILTEHANRCVRVRHAIDSRTMHRHFGKASGLGSFPQHLYYRCFLFFELRSKRIMTQKDSYRRKRTNMTERQNVRV